MTKHRFLTVTLVAFPLIGSAHGSESDRLASEAASLFRVIIAAEPAPKRCRYESDWAPDPLPEDVARDYLGSTLHADLAAPTPNADFRATVDPDKRFTFAFCDPAERTPTKRNKSRFSRTTSR